MNREQLDEIDKDAARLEQMLCRSGDDPAAVRARALRVARSVPALLDEIERLRIGFTAAKLAAMGVSVPSSSAGGHTECGTCGEELKAIGDTWWHAAPEGDQLPDHPAAPLWVSDRATTAEGIAEGDQSKGSSTGGVS